MPDFTARVAVGASVVDWEDPASGTLPSRVNPREGHPMRRLQATLGATIQVRATVGAVDGPLDAALAGRLFHAWNLEHASPGDPPWTYPAGQTSVESMTPPSVGHYVFGLRRTDGGAVVFHLDVVIP